jgi:hypothetical protein
MISIVFNARANTRQDRGFCKGFQPCLRSRKKNNASSAEKNVIFAGGFF